MIIILMIKTLNLYFKSISVFVPVKFILTELLILMDELLFEPKVEQIRVKDGFIPVNLRLNDHP
jgi:hypothetical protein